MDKSDSAHPASGAIAIQEGDWAAYRSHTQSLATQASELECTAGAEDGDDELQFATAGVTADSSGRPLTPDDDVMAYRRECARAYIGMNGRLGGRAYRANAPVILTPDAVGELAELNRLLREERAGKKKR